MAMKYYYGDFRDGTYQDHGTPRVLSGLISPQNNSAWGDESQPGRSIEKPR